MSDVVVITAPPGTLTTEDFETTLADIADALIDRKPVAVDFRATDSLSPQSLVRLARIANFNNVEIDNMTPSLSKEMMKVLKEQKAKKEEHGTD